MVLAIPPITARFRDPDTVFSGLCTAGCAPAGGPLSRVAA